MNKRYRNVIAIILLFLMIVSPLSIQNVPHVHAESSGDKIYDCNSLPKNSVVSYTCDNRPNNAGLVYNCGSPLNAGGTSGYFTGGTLCKPTQGSICNICHNNYATCPHSSGLTYGGTVCSPYPKSSTSTTICNICHTNYSTCPHVSGRTYNGVVCSPYTSTTTIYICNICGSNYASCPHISGHNYGGTVCSTTTGLICNIDKLNYSYCSHSSGTIYGQTWVPATPNTYHQHNSSCQYNYTYHAHTSNCSQGYTQHTHTANCPYHYVLSSSYSDSYLFPSGGNGWESVIVNMTYSEDYRRGSNANTFYHRNVYFTADAYNNSYDIETDYYRPIAVDHYSSSGNVISDYLLSPENSISPVHDSVFYGGNSSTTSYAPSTSNYGQTGFMVNVNGMTPWGDTLQLSLNTAGIIYSLSLDNDKSPNSSDNYYYNLGVIDKEKMNNERDSVTGDVIVTADDFVIYENEALSLIKEKKLTKNIDSSDINSIVDLLIEKKVLYNQAKKAGYELTDEYIWKKIEGFKKSARESINYNDYLTYLSATGLSEDDYWKANFNQYKIIYTINNFVSDSYNEFKKGKDDNKNLVPNEIGKELIDNNISCKSYVKVLSKILKEKQAIRSNESIIKNIY